MNIYLDNFCIIFKILINHYFMLHIDEFPFRNPIRKLVFINNSKILNYNRKIKKMKTQYIKLHSPRILRPIGDV